MRSTACAAACAAGQRDTLFALDFDGVLCDSVGESALSAWKARSERASEHRALTSFCAGR